MIKILDKIRSEEGLEIALLSNIGFEHAKLVHKLLSYDECGFFFNHKHFSCEVGARKPTKLFYQSFLMQHPEFQGCLYVDDLQENLDAADELGFRIRKFSLQDTDVKQRIYNLGKIIRGDYGNDF
jgi:FMN phosphatase YigB (HAD superfamily)